MRALTVVGDGQVINPAAQKIAKKIGKKLAKSRKDAAELVLHADRGILIDGSGSMEARDAVGLDGVPTSRWGALEQAVGKMAGMVRRGRLVGFTFAGSVRVIDGIASGKGIRLRQYGGSTPMRAGLEALGQFYGLKRAMVVGDGCPTDGSADEVVAMARALGVPIDTVYVGPDVDEMGAGLGKALMVRVAQETGGAFWNAAGEFDAVKFLKEGRQFLLRGGKGE